MLEQSQGQPINYNEIELKLNRSLKKLLPAALANNIEVLREALNSSDIFKSNITRSRKHKLNDNWNDTVDDGTKKSKSSDQVAINRPIIKTKRNQALDKSRNLDMNNWLGYFNEKNE